MRKENPARYSSAVGEAWMHCMFKVKYCHKIFDDDIYREAMRTLLEEAAYLYQVPLDELGFDDNHLHFLADICLYDRPTIAKLLCGYTAKKFFKFWGSGLWNSAYYIGSPKDLAHTRKYIQNQKYGSKGRGKEQKTLFSFAA